MRNLLMISLSCIALCCIGCSATELTSPQGTHFKTVRFLMKSDIRELLYEPQSDTLLLYGYSSNPIDIAVQAFNMGLQAGQKGQNYGPLK